MDILRRVDLMSIIHVYFAVGVFVCVSFTRRRRFHHVCALFLRWYRGTVSNVTIDIEKT